MTRNLITKNSFLPLLEGQWVSMPSLNMQYGLAYSIAEQNNATTGDM
jgi:hypothetical protein